MTRFDAHFQAALDARATRGLRRSLTQAVPDGTGHAAFDGVRLLDLSSNDYLGLSAHPALRARSAEWAQAFGTGARASRLVSGTLPQHVQVEARLAAFKGCEAALIFASGWQANAAIVPALLGLSTGATGHPPLVFADRLIHASLHHGIAAANARQIRFRHNDLAHLETLLAERQNTPGLRFILTESVFSMDGDRADVAALAALAARYDAFLYVDEAHATGVLGPQGAGLAAGTGCDLVMGTFSKAFGGFGAYVAGSSALCDYLTNACSGLIYSTAPPPALLGAVDAALDLVPGMDAARADLLRRAADLRALLHEAGLETGDSTTQIVPVLIGDADRALAVSKALRARSVLGIAIRPPTVPPNSARLRLALSALHDDDAIRKAADAVIAAVRDCA